MAAGVRARGVCDSALGFRDEARRRIDDSATCVTQCACHANAEGSCARCGLEQSGASQLSELACSRRTDASLSCAAFFFGDGFCLQEQQQIILAAGF